MLWEPGLAARQEGDAKAHPGSSLRDAPDSSGSVCDVGKDSISPCKWHSVMNGSMSIGNGRGEAGGAQQALSTATRFCSPAMWPFGQAFQCIDIKIKLSQTF